MSFNVYKFLRFILILVLFIDISFFFLVNKSNIVIKEVIPESVESSIHLEQWTTMNNNEHTYQEEVKEKEIQDKIIEEIEMPEYDIKLSKKLQKFTWELCKEYNVIYEMILGMLKLESNFNPKLASRNPNKTTDRGMAQINNKYEDYHVGLVGVEEFDPYNPEKSIELCVKLMAYYNDYWTKQGIEDDLIYTYSMGYFNRGLVGFKNYIEDKGTPSTAYSRIVLRNVNELKEHGEFLN